HNHITFYQAEDGIRDFHVTGVQTCALPIYELVRLDRRHDAARARRAVADARAAGFDNVSLDLMMWLPGQTRERWRASVEALIARSEERRVGKEFRSTLTQEAYEKAHR